MHESDPDGDYRNQTPPLYTAGTIVLVFLLVLTIMTLAIVFLAH